MEKEPPDRPPRDLTIREVELTKRLEILARVILAFLAAAIAIWAQG